MEITLVGSTGLVGSEVLNQLLSEEKINRINVLTRKKITIQSPKLINYVVDFEKEDELSERIQGECIICCIGTTKAKTPDVTVYEKIDRDIPIRLAQIAKKKNVNQYHLISAIGANSQSKINYNRIKGEAEEGVQKSSISHIYIYRPGLLIGNRNESRPGEWIAQKISFLFDLFLIGPLQKYHSVRAEKLAQGIVKNILNVHSQKSIFQYYPFD